MIKNIQAGYLVSSYFKDIYLYLAQNNLPSNKSAIKKIEVLAEKYILLNLLLFKIVSSPDKETAGINHTGGMCRQNNYFIPLKFICGTSGSNKDLPNNKQ